MAIPLPTVYVTDNLIITHGRSSTDPRQRSVLKKNLRLTENELEENRGVPWPRSPTVSSR